MSSEDILIDVRNLSKRYEIYDKPPDRLKQMVVPPFYSLLNRFVTSLGLTGVKASSPYYREFRALHNISFQLRRGETMGIIGRNGSGKSTLLQIIAGTLTPTSGEVVIKGRVAALLELGSGFNPDFTGKENVYLNGRILGLTKYEIDTKYQQIIEFADIGEFINQPVKTYSSGMYVRLAFAVQAHIDASIVIIDEALAVGDIFFRQKCYARLEQLRQSGAAILLVTHAMTEVEQFCKNALLLKNGHQMYLGPAIQATKHYYLQEQNNRSKAVFDTINDTEDSVKSASINPEQWPAIECFRRVHTASEVSNGWGTCTGYVVCDSEGVPCNSFSQGETAVFYYEFTLSHPIGVPLAGLVLQNERGINVHGKGSLEYFGMAPGKLSAGTRIQCRQCVELKLEIGEYSYEIGLATIDAESYMNVSKMGHEEFFSRITRLCHLPAAGVISVGWRKVTNGPALTHHGIADLPGSFDFRIDQK